MARDLSNLDIVKVTWYDATSSDDWTDLADVDLEPAKITSVGYLLEDNEVYILLVQNLDAVNDSMSMIMAIPSLWIESIELLAVQTDGKPPQLPKHFKRAKHMDA